MKGEKNETIVCCDKCNFMAHLDIAKQRKQAQQELEEIIRNKVMENIIDKSSSQIGCNMNDFNLSLIEIKNVLYNTLDEIKKKFKLK